MDSCAWCLNDLMSAHTQCPVSLQSSGDGCLLPQRPGTFLQLGTVLVLMSQSDYWGWHDPRGRLTTCCLITWAPSWLLVHSAPYSVLSQNNSSCSEWSCNWYRFFGVQLISVLRKIMFGFLCHYHYDEKWILRGATQWPSAKSND